MAALYILSVHMFTVQCIMVSFAISLAMHTYPTDGPNTTADDRRSKRPQNSLAAGYRLSGFFLQLLRGSARSVQCKMFLLHSNNSNGAQTQIHCLSCNDNGDAMQCERREEHLDIERRKFRFVLCKCEMLNYFMLMANGERRKAKGRS